MCFFDSLGYPYSTIEFLPYNASPGLVDTSVTRLHDGYHDQMFKGFLQCHYKWTLIIYSHTSFGDFEGL